MEVTSAEALAGHYKIEYADGSSEDILNGIYERKNAAGDTVEQRAAQQSDIDRLSALAVQFEASLGPITANVVEVSIVGTSIEIKYSDGTREAIADGVYERKDANNDTIIERAATEDDATRLNDLAGSAGTGTGAGGDDGTPDQGPGDN